MTVTPPAVRKETFSVGILPWGFFLCLIVNLPYTEHSERVGTKGSDRFRALNGITIMPNEKTTTEDVSLNPCR